MRKSILITGCSTGIGLCAAQTLHKKGYRVFATARKDSDIAMLNALGVEALKMDVTNSASIRAGLDFVLAKTGGTLDALFNNAGYAIPGAIEDLTREMIRTQFETNVFGAMELTSLVLPVMRKQGHGHIVQNTSILGIITIPYRGNYNASKFALEGFSNTLRQELRGTKINVVIIAPGPIETQFRQNAYKSYANTLKNKNSIYQENYKEMEESYRNPGKIEQNLTLGPEAVVKDLLKALESTNPQAHYYIGFSAKMFAMIRRLLPDKTFDWIITHFVK